MGKSPPRTQTITQKTEIDPIQKSFLFGTPLPDDYRKAMEERNRGIIGLPDPQGRADGGLINGAADGYAQGGIIGLADPGMMPGQLPNLSDREQAYFMGMQALQGATQPQQPMMMPQQGYAMGGNVSPPVQGGYLEGPGTGRSDDIPATIYQGGVPVQDAALSDGEFVMTERAVRGAGGGDREEGAARMYEMMRRFENGGGVA